MAYEEYFTNEDKPYSENLNDALLLLDAFDVTVPVKMPDMFSNGEFTSNLNLARKCGVGIITLISKGSGVTIGTNTITGTGEVVFRVYPNFNGFYKWQSIILQKTNTVNVAFRKPDGSSISATVSSDGTISDNNALKQLLEVDLVLTLTNATISSILINFINNHTKTDRVSALLEASQLVNVDGTVATGNTEAVNGGTVKTALDTLHSTVSDEIDDLSDSVDSDLSLKEDKANKVTLLTSSDTQYPSSNAVKSVIDTIKQILYETTTMKIEYTGINFNISRIFYTGTVFSLWGDGTISTNNFTHNYSSNGNYSIELKGKITNLGDTCFTFCTGLTNIIIPSSVTSIGDNCFSGCTGLTRIYLKWTNSNTILTYDNTWLKNVNSNCKLVIPAGTTSLYTAKGYPSDKLIEG